MGLGIIIFFGALPLALPSAVNDAKGKERLCVERYILYIYIRSKHT